MTIFDKLKNPLLVGRLALFVTENARYEVRGTRF